MDRDSYLVIPIRTVRHPSDGQKRLATVEVVCSSPIIRSGGPMDTGSIVVRQMEYAGDGYGLVCLDWGGRNADLDHDAVALVNQFVANILTDRGSGSDGPSDGARGTVGPSVRG